MMRQATTASVMGVVMGVGALSVCGVGCEGTYRVQRGAPSVLAAFTPPSPEEAARMATDEFDANKRFEGIQLLAGASFAGEPVYVDLFRRSTSDSDAGVRAVAVRALGTHGQPEDASILVGSLKDNDPLVRAEAARGLQRLHNPDAVSALLEAVNMGKEAEERVRREAALALGQYPQGRVAEALITALDDESVAVHFAVQQSLRVLTGQDLGLSRKDWQAWYGSTSTPFAGGGGYLFPVFNRELRYWEYLPFVPKPANETPATPAGLSPATLAGVGASGNTVGGADGAAVQAVQPR